ncbi:glycosyltransferase family 4 protein [Winogradskyella immobilis]|uniref:Glycosyltransferase family 4 protein n=1 Tax=Winogradskyella immobilis TaxID=2816852 RepID=A0ABS8EKF4_9FLAO|nr:glycosyltransferase family 4 protein [Winogradskyella immobilis]MCC1483497.1 glycosyltransferase family 4 protein [Winogradskyella immobilis]MCG0015591.1 glycosyltransferase family 4 protein [Winogradskyella immobilis]
MKDILIITSYFPPEIGAASNRIFHLAKGLKSDYNVSVLTPLPNYPTGEIFKDYKRKYKVVEDIDGITVNRLWIYATVSKHKIVRLFAMLSYSFSLIWFFIWNKIPDKVIIQSPPLLVSFTSMLFLRSKKRKLILNVSDLWPSAGYELGALKKGISYKLLQSIERYNYRTATIILGQSEEILTHIKTIVKNPKTILYRNYPDFLPPQIPKKREPTSKNIKLVYAGLLGVAQGILKLCKELDYSSIELHIYGSGAEEIAITSFIQTHPELTITFHGRISRDKLHKELLKYDVTIIPLLNRIYGSVPSKIFEYARLGLPMIYFGGGEGESIVEKHNLGWVAKVGDYNNLNHMLNTIDIEIINENFKKTLQNIAVKSFDFKTQLETLKQSI